MRKPVSHYGFDLYYAMSYDDFVFLYLNQTGLILVEYDNDYNPKEIAWE